MATTAIHKWQDVRNAFAQWRRWLRERRLPDRRLVDRGPSPGPTAMQFERLRRLLSITRGLVRLCLLGVVIAGGLLALGAFVFGSSQLGAWRLALSRAALAEPFAALSFASTTV